jgi:hypothetical protein
MDFFGFFSIFLLVIIFAYITWVQHYKKSKKLLILDLNGVLIYRCDKLNYKRRNYLDGFLDTCFEHFDVAVWSSAQKHNTERLVLSAIGLDRMKHLKFVWNQDQCIPHLTEQYVFKKPLSKVWDIFPQYNESNTLIMDDSKSKMEDNPPHTWISVKKWQGQEEEEETLKQIEEQLLQKK